MAQHMGKLLQQGLCQLVLLSGQGMTSQSAGMVRMISVWLNTTHGMVHVLSSYTGVSEKSLLHFEMHMFNYDFQHNAGHCLCTVCWSWSCNAAAFALAGCSACISCTCLFRISLNAHSMPNHCLLHATYKDMQT